MIHSEPLITMATITRVNSRASRVQPPSAWVFTCRKKIVWTTIWANARAMIQAAVTRGSPNAPVITSQNGAAVSTADSAKPIR